MERNGPRWSSKTEPKSADATLDDLASVLGMKTWLWLDENGKIRVYWRAKKRRKK